VRGTAAKPKAEWLGVRLVFPSETSFLGLVRDVSRKMAEGFGFDETTASQIALAVDEAATNVLEHAYHGAAGRPVELCFLGHGTQFRVEVRDAGDRVDPREVPEVDLHQYATERRTGGLGVHLMGKIMDSVTFQRSRGHNVCCLVKRRPGAMVPR
jgi:anti-sigma regulatory factor (Ser/Thr protein kinase)